MTTFALAAAIFVGVAAGMYRQGVSSSVAAGRLDGYASARDEKAAAAWANTPEGQIALDLAKAGSLRALASCSGKGWKRKTGSCVPRCEKGSVDGWNLDDNAGGEWKRRLLLHAPGTFVSIVPGMLGARSEGNIRSCRRVAATPGIPDHQEIDVPHGMKRCSLRTRSAKRRDQNTGIALSGQDSGHPFSPPDALRHSTIAGSSRRSTRSIRGSIPCDDVRPLRRRLQEAEEPAGQLRHQRLQAHRRTRRQCTLPARISAGLLQLRDRAREFLLDRLSELLKRRVVGRGDGLRRVDRHDHRAPIFPLVASRAL